MDGGWLVAEGMELSKCLVGEIRRNAGLSLKLRIVSHTAMRRLLVFSFGLWISFACAKSSVI